MGRGPRLIVPAVTTPTSGTAGIREKGAAGSTVVRELRDLDDGEDE